MKRANLPNLRTCNKVNISVNDVPFRTIKLKSFARPLIHFNGNSRLKPGSLEAEIEPPSASEQANCLEHGIESRYIKGF